MPDASGTPSPGRHAARPANLHPLGAIANLYQVLDSGPLARVHVDGVDEAAARIREARAMLAAVAVEPAGKFVVNALGMANSALTTAREEVIKVQLDERDAVVAGELEGLPPPRPFRASTRLPQLHAMARPPLLPWFHLEDEEEQGEPSNASALPKHPRTFEELAAFSDAARSGELARAAELAPVTPEQLEEVDTPLFEPALADIEVLRELAQQCLEAVAGARTLRVPIVLETWRDVLRFEQHLLNDMDAFVALGAPALPTLSLYVADAPAPDPERAFALAFVLGCIDGADTIGAVMLELRTGPPELLPGFVDGLALAPHHRIDEEMLDLVAHADARFAATALEVIWRRGGVPAAVARRILATRDEPRLCVLAVRALRRAGEPEVDELSLESSTSSGDVDVALEAATSLVVLQRQGGLVALRRLAASPGPARGRAARLLALGGTASDAAVVCETARTAPWAPLIDAIGRLGASDAIDTLQGLLGSDDEEVVDAAARALARITGGDMRMTVEEPWDLELPDGAVAIPPELVPMRKVDKAATDASLWAAFLHGKRFDPTVKWRGGQPFVANTIVAELGAGPVPLEARAEAALELELLVGGRASFDVAAWVHQQEQRLVELHALGEIRSWSPGAFRSDRRAVAAVSPPPDRSARARLSSTMMGSMKDVAAALPFIAGSPSAPQAVPPKALRPAVPRAKLETPVGDITATMSRVGPLLPALPFASSDERPISGMEPPVASPPSPLVAPPIVVVPPVALTPAAPAPATAEPPSVSRRRPDPLDSTGPIDVGALRESGLLPFPKRDAPQSMRQGGAPSNSATPFQSTNRQALSTPPGGAALNAPQVLSLPIYAEICAAISLAPGRAEDAVRRHGLPDRAAFRAIDQAWQERLAADPDLRLVWTRLVDAARSRQRGAGP